MKYPGAVGNPVINFVCEYFAVCYELTSRPIILHFFEFINQEIGELHEVQERRATDFEASNL